MRVESSIYEIKGKELILRNPEESDAERLLSYLKITSRETPYLIKRTEEITLTLEEEKEFIKGQNNSEHNLLLIGLLNGEHVGKLFTDENGFKTIPAQGSHGHCFVSEIHRAGHRKDHDRKDIFYSKSTGH